MGNYFDYSRPDMPNMTEGLSSLGDALTDLMKRRQQQKQFDEKMKVEREDMDRKFKQNQANIDYQNRIINQRAKREGLKFNMDQNAANAARMDRARRAASPQEAQAIMAGTVVYDPETGKELGRGNLTPGEMRDIGPEPVAPTPVQRPELPEEGPVPTPEITRQAEIRRMGPQARTGAPPEIEARLQATEDARQEFEAKQRRYEPQSQAYSAYAAEAESLPARQAAFAADKRRAEYQRPYTMSAPGQPDVTFDFETQHYAANKEAADRFLDTVSQLPLKPTDVQAAKVAHGAILAGQDPQKVFKQFQDERLLGIKQDYGATEGGLTRQNKLDVQALRNEAPRPSINIGDRKLGYQKERDRSQFLRDDLKGFLAKNAAKEIGDADRETTNLQTNLASGEPGTIRNGLLKLWQIAQHDTRMSDKDAVLANTLDQSVLSQLQGWISKGAEGVPGELNLQAAQDTARRLRGYFVAKNAELKDQYKHEFVDSGQYDPKEADVLGAQTFPGWQRLTENQAAPKGRGTSGKRRSLPELNRKPAESDPVGDALKRIGGAQ